MIILKDFVELPLSYFIKNNNSRHNASHTIKIPIETRTYQDEYNIAKYQFIIPKPTTTIQYYSQDIQMFFKENYNMLDSKKIHITTVDEIPNFYQLAAIDFKPMVISSIFYEQEWISIVQN
jgi:hypothetical protein